MIKYEIIIAFIISVIAKPQKHSTKVIWIIVTATCLVVLLNFEKHTFGIKFKRNPRIEKKFPSLKFLISNILNINYL